MLAIEQCWIVEQTVGYGFRDKSLISQALTAPSFVQDHPAEADNELLRLLGGSVLKTAITGEVLERLTTRTSVGIQATEWEGEIKELIAELTDPAFLRRRTSRLGLQRLYRIGFQEVYQPSRHVLDGLLEALIGAVYLDSNKNIAALGRTVALLIDLDGYLAGRRGEMEPRAKEELQLWCDLYGLGGASLFAGRAFGGVRCTCRVNLLGVSEQGFGATIEEAEIDASKRMLELLRSRYEDGLNRKTVLFHNSRSLLETYVRQNHMEPLAFSRESRPITGDIVYPYMYSCRVGGYTGYGMSESEEDAINAASDMILQSIGLVQA
ncbi:MAG: hypothetical protein ACI4U2_02130 [Christensenellaceae bacterium]